MAKVVFNFKNLAIFAVAVMMLVACNKEVTQPTADSTEQEKFDFFKISLMEFSQTCTDDEKRFLTTSEIIDNNHFYKDYLMLKRNNKTNLVSKPKIYFRWSGINNNKKDCGIKPLGICIIFKNSTVHNGSIEVDATIWNGKILLSFPDSVNSNFGLTSDGYLPVSKDVQIPNEVASDLGISHSSKIKSGIYKAYYDSVQNKYTGIALDIY
jgi:hypothetical protein